MSHNSQLFERLAKGDKLNTEEVGQLRIAWEKNESQQDVLARYLDVGAQSVDFEFPFVPLYSNVLEADFASVAVPIPNSYKHLLVYFTGRTNGTGGSSANDLYCEINGDTGASNYLWQAFSAHNASSSIGQDLTDAALRLAIVQSDGAAAGLAGTAHIFIGHYNSSYKKNCICNWGFPLGSGEVWTGQFFSQYVGTDPITNLNFRGDTALYPNVKLEAGSLISVYGLL